MKQKETKWYFEDYMGLMFDVMALLFIINIFSSSEESVQILFAIAAILSLILAQLITFTEKVLRRLEDDFN